MTDLSMRMLIRRIDLLSLRLFLSAVDQNQIGKAAALENIAPSAATKRIQDLETTFGARLLERSPKGVLPSKAGEVLAHHIRSLFDTLDTMRRELGEFTAGVRGHIRIATPVSILVRNLADEIGEFQRAFPTIGIEIREDINPAVVRAAVTGDVDLGVFVHSPELDLTGLAVTNYRSDRLVAIHPVNHAFSLRKNITITDLVEERIVGVRTATSLMSNLRVAAEASGNQLDIQYSVSSTEAARSLVAAGLGIAVLPEGMQWIDDDNRLGCVSIAEPWAERKIMLAVRSDQPTSAATRLLIEQLTGRIGSECHPVSD